MRFTLAAVAGDALDVAALDADVGERGSLRLESVATVRLTRRCSASQAIVLEASCRALLPPVMEPAVAAA